jgi:hypothetical protein
MMRSFLEILCEHAEECILRLRIMSSSGSLNRAFADLFKGKRILWQTFFGSYAVGLDRLLPIEFITCLDDGSDYDLVRETCGVRLCSVEETRGRRINWIGSGIQHIFEQRRAAIDTELRRHPKDSWLLTSSPPCALMEAFCDDRGYRMVGTPARIVEQFKHKTRLLEALDALQLPRLPGRWLRFAEAHYEDLASEVGASFVVQKAIGAAGSGTALVRSDTDWRGLDSGFASSDVWVAPYLGELSFNVNAAVCAGQVCVGFPNVQLAGFAELGAPWGGYCGNDYSATAEIPQDIIEDVQFQTERVGAWLQSRGFDGIYGLDFVLDPASGRAYAVDLNPRWQGSTSLSAQAEYEAGRLPLAVAVFAAQSGVLGPGDIRASQDEFRKPVLGSQLNLRARLREAAAAMKSVRPGAYPRNPQPACRRACVRLTDLTDGEEYLVTGGVPRRGVVVEPGAWLSRIMARAPAVRPESMALLPWAQEAARDLHAAFGFEGLPPTP